MSWTIASDIARRIKDLRTALGSGGRTLLQQDLASRAGVRPSQVSQWERGAQRPSRSRLERWAAREGWPVSIFAEGHPPPSAVLPASEPAAEGRGNERSRPQAVLSRFYEVMAQAAARGQAPPPELAALIQEMYQLTRADSASKSARSGAEPEATVPDW